MGRWVATSKKYLPHQLYRINLKSAVCFSFPLLVSIPLRLTPTQGRTTVPCSQLPST